ncbi:hypothetical protein SCOR_31660 [Sulfidibacter corallicola]|uniref:YD repeat-containing protein n=1 Tax=Sulfidibacter corallicola TaxID=2818388 RepID=A0A8A4TL14_SULCO|nr:hypothetical protein [Sulfidibacter corallicola]QTD49894.1 hypothetical protein J3U87_30295 [Sulfidibacter corallicola]
MSPLFPRKWRLRILLCCLALVAHALHAQDESLDDRFSTDYEPFTSDSEKLGLKTEAPFVNINEFTGKVSINLPGLDLGDFGLAPRYNGPNRWPMEPEGDFNYDFGARGDYERSPLGIGWHLGYGFMVARQINTVARVWENVGYVDNGGNFSAFTRDQVFMEPVTDSGELPTRGVHYISNDLSRITRSPSGALPFQGGAFYLFSANGRKIKFMPTAYDPNAHILSQTNYLEYFYFYPVEITQPNGRRLTISYTQDLMDNERPLIDYVQDSHGRRLYFRYTTILGKPYLESLVLTDGRSPDEPKVDKREIRRFEYLTLRAPGDSQSHVYLGAVVSPLGHRFEVQYQSAKTHPDQSFLMVDGLTTPEGGEIGLTYMNFETTHIRAIRDKGCVNKYDCHDPDLRVYTEDWVRVRTLSHSGGSYLFSYRQGTIESPWHWRTKDVSVLDVSVTLTSGFTDKPYRRTTTYFGHPRTEPAYKDGQAHGDAYVMGRPIHKIVSYGEGGDMETAEQRWEYSAKLSPHPHYYYGGNADSGRLFEPYLMKHSRLEDGQWVDTHFEYERVDADPSAGSFLNPIRQFVQARGFAPQRIHTTDYDHRFTKLDRFENAVDDVYFIGLPKLEEVRFESSLIGKVSRTFHPLWPLPTRVTKHSGAGSESPDVVTAIEYYEGGTYLGLEKSRSIPGTLSKIEQVAYRWGMPSIIRYPIGPDRTRSINLDGTIATETQNGVTKSFEYDSDGRLVKTVLPGGMLPDEVRYSEPGAPPFEESFRRNPDNGSLSGFKREIAFGSDRGDDDRTGSGDLDYVSRTRENYDAWGRLASKELRVNHLQDGIVEETLYNAYGLPRLKKNLVDGSQTSIVYDVLGRPVLEKTTEGSVELSVARYRYGWDGAGQRRLEVIQKNRDTDTESYIRVTLSDMAERMVRAEANGQGTNFQYDGDLVTIRPDHPDPDFEGHLRRQRVDSLGRMIWEEQPEINGRINYTYNEFGKVDEVEGPAGHYRSTYDALARLTKQQVKRDGLWETLFTNVYDWDTGILKTKSANGVIETVEESDQLNRPTLVSLTIPDLKPGPEVVYPLANTRVPPGLLQADWEPVPGAVDYEFAFETQGTSAKRFSVQVGNSHTDVPVGVVTTDMEHSLFVRAIDENGEPTNWTRVDFSGGENGPCIAADVGNLDFGTVIVNQNENRSIVFTNTGNQPGTAVLTTINNTFKILDDSGAPVTSLSFSLNPGFSKTVTLRMRGSTPGLYASSLRVDAECASDIDLIGQIIPEPSDIRITPTTYDFGEIDADQVAFGFIDVENIGSRLWTVTLRTLTESGSFDFYIDQTWTSVGDIHVGAGRSKRVQVRFNPSEGRDYHCTIRGDSGGGHAIGYLIGKAVEDIPQFDITPSLADFGEVPDGQIRQYLITVTNQGAQTVTGVVNASGSDFSVHAVNGVPGSNAISIPAGGSAQVTVYWQKPSWGQSGQTFSGVFEAVTNFGRKAITLRAKAASK